MNAQDALKLARRFIELPEEKRRLFLDGLQQQGVDFALFPIPAEVLVEARDGLSYAQQRMWFLWQLDPQSAAYNLPMAVRLNGELDSAALQTAFDALVARHETLRSQFSEHDGVVRQRIVEPFAVNIVRHDLSGLAGAEREEQVRSLADAEALAPFDLAQGPLLRVQLLKLADQEHVLLLTLHHIVADGWSYNVLIDEFIRLYDAASSGGDAALQPLPIQYRDYALWQRSWLEAGEQDRQLDYWRNKLGDDHSPLELPIDHARPVTPSYRGARHEFQVEPALAERLRGLAREQGVTLFMVLLAAFKVLLQRYSGQSAIRVGVPVANRNRAEVEGLIGCFINTQVLHTEIDPLIDVRELLQRVKETALGAQGHQELPFERLVEVFEPQRSLGRNPLFQVLFNHQPSVVDAGQISTRSGLSLEKVRLDKHSARLDLSLDTYESAGQLHAAFTYALDLFDGATVSAMQQHWLQVLEGLATRPENAVGELPLTLPELEYAAETAEVAGQCIHQLIEQSAAAQPQRIAAVTGEQQIDYLTLNQRANAVAQVLLDSGVLPDQRVGVIADRSIDMLVGILAVVKAGAAYLPLEPEQPRERLDFMLADSNVRLVLSAVDWSGELPEAVSRIALDAKLRAVSAPAVQVDPANLAYVIYTSGTTGLPKGVGISHAALVNYVQGVSRRLPLDELLNLAMVTTPAADLGHTVFYGALCNGKTLHMLDKNTVLDAEAFAAYMSRHAIDALKIVPSHLQAMLAVGAAALPRRCLIVGGESCSAALLARIATLAPEMCILNHYGPTETTVGVLTHDMADQPLLGRPLVNTRAQVLSDCLQGVPGSARGELYISGAGLARGYLGRPALTAERFVPDPAAADGARMYRTGDWVRCNAKGELLFAGRMDGQVKIRGYRVELAEIESQLRQLPGISNAVVRVMGDNSAPQLAAWLVPTAPVVDEAGKQAFLDEVRRELKQSLPEHMQPTHMLALEQLPVTANGKVDIKALPQPQAHVASYVAPVTPLQLQLAQIWAQVLQVGQVGLTDNFFALGGHSLLATQVVSRARKQLDVDIPLRALFDTSNLQAFATSVQRLDSSGDSGIPLLDRSAPLAVSHAQYRQWLFWKLNPQSTAYNTPLAVKLQGELNGQALQAAFDALVARHESLRTVFQEQDGQPWQRIVPVAAVPIAYEDLTGQAPDTVTHKLEEQVSTVFDLEHGPLIRVTLFKTAEHEHLLSLMLHHIVSDGWSMSVMVRELAATYNAHAAGQRLEQQPLPVQYADYAAWQRQRLADGQLHSQLAYWKATLEDDFSVLQLPTDHPRPQEQSYRGGRIDIHLPAELTDKLRALAVSANATLFHVFLSSFAILLSRYSGSEKINIGIPVTNRNRLELEGLIGFFVNTIIARVAVDPVQSFDSLLASVKETTLQAQANKDIPFDALVEALKPERTLGYNPLFQVMYNHLRDFGERVSSGSASGLHVEEVDWVEQTAQFDLSLDTLERSDGVMASFGYASDLFEAERIERLVGHWLALLEGVALQTDAPSGELSMLEGTEQTRISRGWNPARSAYQAEPSLLCQLQEQARNRPDAVALVLEDNTLSYAQLNRRANRLAHQLREMGVGPEVRVGIAVERSFEMVIGLLGILKAGGAYVPLDPEYPEDRLAYMLEDSGIRVLLTQAWLKDRLAVSPDVSLVELAQGEEAFARYSDNDPVIEVLPENLAYVIYTSGSTGRPKGVAIAHGELSAFCSVARDYSRLSADDRVLQFATVSFDGFVEQLYPALSCGAQVVLRGQQLWSITTLKEQIDRHGVTLADLPTAYWRLLAAEGVETGSCTSLRQVHVGGEAMPPEGLRDWLASDLKHARLVNTYGPTEATVVSTVFDCSSIGADDIPQANMPIGTAIGGRTTYICDSGLQIAPAGCVSELLIGGSGCLARGYFNRPALTAERFIPDPFCEQGGGRLYRTGDLARYLDDGVIEYAGRIDHQVKIRGFRIELGEIEARLQEQEAVRDAVVLAQQGAGGAQLVGYIVPVDRATMASPDTQAALREILRTGLKLSLPDYMVPAHLLFIEKLPLTLNGKLDRKALPEADASLLQQTYIEPTSELERQVAAIWQDVLKLQRVGLFDNFFELGGDSIVSLQVVSRARQAGIQLTPKDLFQHQTVQALAQVAQRTEARVIDQGPVSGTAPLTPIQQWFFAQAIPERHHWNQSVLLELRQPLSAASLRSALQALVNQHDALRSRFVHDHADYQQVDAGELLWTREAADAQALYTLGDEAQRSLSLEQGPLLRAMLIDLADGGQRLLLAIHHLVVDGVSWRLLLEDLQTACNQVQAGQSVKLPARTSSFKAWAEHLQDYAVSQACTAELSYWQQQLASASDVLPCDNAGGARQRKHAAYANTRLSLELTTRLLQEAPAAYRTQINDLLLTALARVICRWSGQPEALIRLEGHGREDLFNDLDLTRTVGWFTSMYPVKLTPQAELAGSIKQIKEQLRSLPNKGIGYGLLRYLGSAETKQTLSQLPQGEIVFNYLGRFDDSFAGEDSLFMPAKERGGREQSDAALLDSLLSINGQVYDGELSLDWTFSREVFDESTIERLAQAYGEELTALIEHCCDERNRGITPSDFPLAKLTQTQLDSLPMAPEQIADLYPLSPMQQGMLFHSLYEQQTGDYINQMCVAVEGLDVEKFRQAWQQTVNAHDTLRSGIVWEGRLEHPVQVVFKQARLPFAVHDWRTRSDTAQALLALAHAERQQGFELSQAPLLRLAVVHLGANQHHLIFTNHHILMDGWSNSRLLGEVLQRYVGHTVAPVSGRYRDYIAWLQRQDAVASELFWKGQLAELEGPTQLSQAVRCEAADAHGYGDHYQRFDQSLTQRLKAFAQQHKTTVNTLVQSAWLLLLQRYTGQDTVCFGATVAGRPTELPGVEEQIGLFINTLPVIASPRPEQSVIEWVSQVQAQNLQLREQEHTPLYEVQRWAGRGSESLFDNILVFENYPVSEALQQGAPGGLKFGATASHEQTNYPMTLTVGLDDTLSVHYSYAFEHFSAQATEQLASHFQSLLMGLIVNAQAPIGELTLRSDAERRRFISEWDLTQTAYPSTHCIHQLFEAQAAQHPDKPALLAGEQQLSYAELNRQANRLAHRLIEMGIGPDIAVGVALERGMQMVVGLLAILKAGGAYVPLDPEYPRDRLQYMLENSGARLVLSQAQLRDRLPLPAGVERLELDDLDRQLVGLSDANPQNRAMQGNLAYVMYTSGSTGRPKGVGINHGSLTRHAFVSISFFNLTPDDRILQFATFNFDGFVEQLYPALICGASVVIRGQEIWDSETFYRVLIDKDISVVDLTTAYWFMLAKDFQNQPGRSYGRLRQVHCGGEAMPPEGVAAWRKAGLGHVRLLNTYGPTEATVTVTAHDCAAYLDGTQPLPTLLPIGRALAGRSIYVVDNSGDIVTQAAIGELLIGGDLLARGYHARPSLTAERFIPDPFAEQGGGRLYRTGDLARYLDEGVIEYAGRIDHQVKIRGFRIELGEIEARLLEHPAVGDALVLAHQGPNGHQLVAHIVPVQTQSSEAASVLRDTLRTALKDSLPDYMVPSWLMFLDKLPLTPNGKLDRKALPVPDGHQQQAYVAPQSALEQQIALIWQDVLKLEQVGLTDNFFELGGDSIISLQVVSRARQSGIGLTPKDLFQHQTVQALALIARRTEGLVIDQGAVTGVTPLVPIQQWFFDESIIDAHHWNQSVLLKPGQALQAETLQVVLHGLLNHHDALRLRFVGQQAEDQPVGSDEWLWVRTLGDSSALQPLFNEAQRSLSLEQGPLLRAVLVNLSDGSQRLLLVIHHLVVDGVSWRVLLEDLQTAYQQVQAGQALKLPAKSSSFKAWAEHLHDYAISDACTAELGYWQAQLGDASDALPCDHPDGGRQRKHAAYAQTRLDRETTARLLQQAPAAYRTQINDLLLTALARVICRWSGQPQTLIRLEGHGREDLFNDLDLTRTVGWFTSMYPVKLTPQTELAGSIKQIKEQLRSIPNKGIGYGLLRYLGSAETKQTLSQLPQGEIVFNYLGRFDDSFAGEDSLFMPAKEQGGREQSDAALLDSLLSINGQVYDGELSLDWGFSREVFDEQTIGQLAQAYGEELKALIAHCCDEQHRGVTPSDFPLAGLTQAQLDSLPMAPEQIADLYPLSPMQQGMLFHSLYAQEAGDYINQMRVDIDGLDVQRFRQAWQATVDNQDVLRANFITSLQTPLQAIARHMQVPFVVEDWSSHADQARMLDQRAKDELRQGFDLLNDPLLRLTLIQVAEHRHHLIFTSHHILMDGWSNAQMLGEVLQRYAGQPVPAVAGGYRDYIAWLQRQDPVASETFWNTQLRDLAGPTRLSHALAHTDVQPVAGRGEYAAHLDAQFTSTLSEFSRQQRVTANSVVQAIWLLLLQRYTGQECVTFGATVAGRPTELAGVEQHLGLFINTLPVIASPRPDQSVADWGAHVQAQNLQLREHEHTPLYDVQRWAGWSGEDLFDTLLVFENYPVSEALQQGAPQGLVFSGIHNHEQTNYPLSLGIILEDRGMTIHYNYDRAHFSDRNVQQIAGHFETLLKAAVVDVQAPLAQLPLLSQPQSAQVIADWSQLAATYREDLCIHELIEQRAHQTPDAIAVLCGEQRLSYGELEQRANQLAHKLRELGVGPEVRVAVALGRSVEIIVTFLAVLKAGGAYVPLDMAYPQERLLYMIQDCQAALVLTHSELLDRLALGQGLQTLAVDQQQAWSGYPLTRPDVIPAAENLAYVIYTSGSTGQPKGVAVTHGQIVMHCLAISERYEMSANDCELQFMSLAFDGAHERWLTTLSHGARLLLRGDEMWTPEQVYDVLRRFEVTVTALPPAYLQQLAEYAERVGNPPSVRIYCFGGDAVPQAAYEQVWNSLRPQRIFNGYGPTETVVTPLLWTSREGDECGAAYAPIGTLVGKRCAYVLGADLDLLPAGLSGELYLGGTGVARGYLGRPGLTAERFVPDPFGIEGARVYRSGDLTRARADGLMDYLGRIDHQVKVRGFRIELGEIEACLLQQQAVREAVVLAVEGIAGAQLVAYVVASSPVLDEEQTRSFIRNALKAVLPDYMVPAHIVLLGQLPVTPNGKLDRKGLPKPDVSQMQQAYVSPQSEHEHQMADIWAQVLKLERVGMHDHFFELGGHSLLATQVMLRVREQLGIDMALRDLFDQPKLGDFCQLAVQKNHQDAPLQDELAKSLEALKRLTAEEIDELIS